MPLHLLGKKSWNVYNTANIEKVKADEAKAAAREEAEEQRMQEVDAERRLQILRGGKQIEPPPASADKRIEDESESKRNHPHHHHRDESGRDGRKRRRIAGEDDTDREIRFAREDRATLPAKEEMQMTTEKSSGAPLIDAKGHINLFPLDNRSRKETKNAEVEVEKARKKKEYEDQYTMRFSNAAGFKQAIDQKPWYENTDMPGESLKEDALDIPSSKDVWGNEDPRRKERQRMRVAADDPLAMIRHGAAGVREAERQRMKWREEKAQEIKEIEDDERRRSKRRRRSNVDNVGRFSPSDSHSSYDRHGRTGKDVERAPHHSRRHRSQSRDRDRDRSQRQGSRTHSYQPRLLT